MSKRWNESRRRKRARAVTVKERRFQKVLAEARTSGRHGMRGIRALGWTWSACWLSATIFSCRCNTWCGNVNGWGSGCGLKQLSDEVSAMPAGEMAAPCIQQEICNSECWWSVASAGCFSESMQQHCRSGEQLCHSGDNRELTGSCGLVGWGVEVSGSTTNMAIRKDETKIPRRSKVLERVPPLGPK